MRILIVCSGTAPNFNFSIHQAFIHEQIEAVKKKYELDYDIFLIKSKGVHGYLKAIFDLHKKLKKESFDLIHSHYSFSGIIPLFQLRIPTVVTFHGSDINDKKFTFISNIVHLFSKHSIFVNYNLYEKLLIKKNNFNVIPCGIDLDVFFPFDKNEARQKLGLDINRKYILFSSSFDNKVKNYQLAKAAINLIDNDIILLELKNRTRAEVNLLLNAVDLLLITSFHEGSPQIVKEALACNCPILSTPVGDVRKNISFVNNCKIVDYNPHNISFEIRKILSSGQRSNGRRKVLLYDNNIISEKIYNVYQTMLS